MEILRDARQEAQATLDQLRWLLVSLRMAGISDWPVRPKAPEAVAPELPAERPVAAAVSRESLDDVQQDLGECKRCRLHSGRNRIVFGEGSPRADLVFVGEGPGFDEDRQGRPFVGRAGKLLDKMIGAIGLRREDVYICNVVKCRPPENRTPEAEEAEACSPFLLRQIAVLRPRVVCALGACASQTLLGTSNAISKLRGKVHLWRGMPLVCTYHPAYLLRNPAQKAQTWQDLLEVAKILSSGKEDD